MASPTRELHYDSPSDNGEHPVFAISPEFGTAPVQGPVPVTVALSPPTRSSPRRREVFVDVTTPEGDGGVPQPSTAPNRGAKSGQARRPLPMSSTHLPILVDPTSYDGLGRGFLRDDSHDMRDLRMVDTSRRLFEECVPAHDTSTGSVVPRRRRSGRIVGILFAIGV